MYERFTDRARKVMQLANQEAQRFNHEYIGTEHILLGLVKEGGGIAATVLKNLNIDLRKIRLEVEKKVQSGPDMVTLGKLPQTPRAKKVIELAIEAARKRTNNYVGTEHILLGLLAEKEGVAYDVLNELVGVDVLEAEVDLLVTEGPQLEPDSAKDEDFYNRVLVACSGSANPTAALDEVTKIVRQRMLFQMAIKKMDRST
jgi:ATP-dependent Clp protease ATP-binding subunit ClpC